MKSYQDIAKRCLKDEADAVTALIKNIDTEFDRAVDIILNCKGKVIVTGVGKSGHIGVKIAATLSSTGTPAFYINPLDVYHGDLGVIAKDDVILAISNSGQTDELLRFVPYIKNEGFPLIAMTGNPESLLARSSDCHLNSHVSYEACPLNLAPTSSTTAQLVLGDALACALMEARGFKDKDFARFHPGGSLGRKLLTTAQDVMRTTDLPVISPTLTLGEAILLISKGKLGLGIAVADSRIVGLITDGDIRRATERHGAAFFDIPVEEVMTKSPVTVDAAAKVEEILTLMHRRKIHAVLVVDEDKHLLGVVDNFACGE